ncbi:MAG TPA: malto-oligosyltrehalose synthase [Xanthobacteraceae bacterium]|nr:malto-oligosyltrehalose synthase [Xanthobacteraceae bacterium]
MPSDIPLATYRLQLTKDFGFDDAARLVPYLQALGISHVYASPFLKARAGSKHGYDIVDHTALNPELGGDRGFERLSKALADADMGLILDFVPNHMGVGRADNAWWLDVLEWGPKSPFARFFDIDWETLPYQAEGGVLLPILGDFYGNVLEAGDIKLTFDSATGTFSAWYYEHRLPIRPNRYGDILRTVVAAAGARNEPAGKRLLEIAAWYPDPRAPSREQAPGYKAELSAAQGGTEVIERGLKAYRPSANDPAAVLALHRLLERQHYRLAHWRVAVSEINYRRFFDINDLAGLRVEDMRTFTAVHHLVARLIAENRLHGLRLDHIDGLQNPIQYGDRLQRLVRRVRPAGRGQRPFYTLVEKILAEGEPVPKLPGVAGTTGYEWLNVISRLLLHERGMPQLEQAARTATGNGMAFEEIVMQSKARVLDTMLASEFTVLTRLLARIAAGHWRSRDFTLDRLGAALRLYTLNFPVYRTYITPEGPSDADRETIARAIAAARMQWFGPDPEIFELLQDALTLDLVAPGRQGYSRARVTRFALKVQQLTGPMMAKSLEDTAFYRYFPLLALNEVGGDPVLPALSAAEFHGLMQARSKTSPHGLTATATHDTKRGEDARARLLSLSELAHEWSEHAERWAMLNQQFVASFRGKRAPSRAHEYMLYQALLGAWPLNRPDEEFAERVRGFAVKAAREGKLETSWMNPDEAYEAALTGFVGAILDPSRSAEFIREFSEFARRTALIGALNSLTQLTLKATMPGVPDFYQGTELWDLSLVDPDNRRPVDFAARRAALASVGEAPDWRQLAEHWFDGRIKLALTRKLIALRQLLPQVFTDGLHHPLPVSGPDADHVIAFARTLGRDAVIVIAGRYFGVLTDGGRRWATGAEWDAMVHLQEFEDLQSVLGFDLEPTPGAVHVSALLDVLPVAVLRGKRVGVAPVRPPRRRAPASLEPAASG